MWAKVDDHFFSNPKAAAAGIEGRALYVAGLCHCSAHLTDGIVSEPVLPIVAAQAGVQLSVADTLVSVGLWHRVVGGYEVHGYLDLNPSREQVEKEREAGRQRAAKSRQSRGERTANVRGTFSDPSSPVPSDTNLSSSQSDSRPDDDAYGIEWDEVWRLIAEWKRSQRSDNPSLGWVRKTAANQPTDPHPAGGSYMDRAHELLSMFDIDEKTLAEALTDRRQLTYLKRRTAA